ncbi:MAG: hypothetical protein IKZ38_03900, partial [Clostridia bacterium]|nr:hypothetical protein [Clostridia bacterium]
MKKLQAKKFLTLLLSAIIMFASINLLFFNKKSALAESNTWTYSDCIEVSDFIKDNFTRFVSEYNKTVNNGEILKATHVEYNSIIWLADKDNYGAFIDFNGANGYVVVDGNYTIYEFVVDGDYELLRTTPNLSYTQLDGFMCDDINDSVQKLNIGGQVNQSDDTLLVTSEHPYQELPGDGTIKTDCIDEYVREHYNKYSFSAEYSQMRTTFPYKLQEATSYYIKQYLPPNVMTYTEGNCALNATYMALRSWKQYGHIANLSSATINVTPLQLYDSNSLSITDGTVYTDEKGSYYWI